MRDEVPTLDTPHRRPHAVRGDQSRRLQSALKEAAGSVFVDARRLHRLANAVDWSELPAADAARLADLVEAVGAVEARVAGLSAALEGLAETLADQLGDDMLADDAEPVAESQDATIWVQEQERHRLAREIHDGPAQVLSNAVMEVEFIQRLMERKPERMPDELNKLKRNLRTGLTEVRGFLFDLRPPALHDLGVAVSLQRYAEEYATRFGIQVDLDVACLEERWPSAQEVTIFRIVQEALQNVQRHSGTKRVTVRSRRLKSSLRVEIADQGRGFDPADLPPKRLGLVSMRERAQLAGGQLTVFSQPGHGTRIMLTLPAGTTERTGTTRARLGSGD